MKYEIQFGNFGNTFEVIYIMENGNEISQVFYQMGTKPWPMLPNF
jgi:hypothetical protein